MSRELPTELQAQLCDVAARVRLERATGDEIRTLAGELLAAGVETTATIALASLAPGASRRDARPWFEQMLDELGYPSLDARVAWWLEPRVRALASRDPRHPVDSETFWLELIRACPTFGPKWDPEEADFVTAGDFGEHLLALLASGERPVAARAAEELEVVAGDGRYDELIVTGMFESVLGRMRRYPNVTPDDVQTLLGSRTRAMWSRLVEPTPDVT